MRPSDDNLVGRILGSYELTELLGEGRIGVVYLARHVSIGRRAAVKVLHPGLSSRHAVVQRFFDEVRAANLVHHPGIVDVYDDGQAAGVGAYIVMEYLQGETLRARLARDGAMGAQQVARLVMRIAAPLAAAHAAGIVHRDLKPDNVFLVPGPDHAGEEQVKVLDFGVAKLSQELSGGAVRTRTGTVLGTPLYRSPEQRHGSRAVDARADQYALGVIAYELLCGRPPFLADELGEVAAMHLHAPPPLLRSFNERVPAAVEAVVMRALDEDPDRRWGRIDEMAMTLRGAALVSSEEPAAAPSAPLGSGGRSRRARRRR